MRRLIALGLATLLATGPSSPVWAAGRAVSLGSTGKTISVTAIPLSLGSQAAALSFNSVGSLGFSSNLPTLAPAALPQLNTAAPSPVSASIERAEVETSAPRPAAEAPGPGIQSKENNLNISRISGAPVSRAAPADRQAAPALRTLSRLSANQFKTGLTNTLFDGAQNRADAETPEAAPRSEVQVEAKQPRRSLLRGLGRLLTAPIRLVKFKKSPKVDTEYTKDDFGGYKALQPKALPENASRFRQIRARIGMHAGYGLKWGLNLFAIATVLDTVVSPLIAAIPWQLFLSEAALASYGRVELLTAFGPAQIAQAMAASPLSFLLLALPAAVLMEELRHRVMSFGGWFIGAALARPAASKLSDVLESIPDVSGLRSTVQWMLRRIATVSKHSFLIGATLSSVGFAAAHIAMWGFSPYILLYHAVMGYALAHVAYRSRFIAAPFIAHFMFNALTISAAVLAPAMLGAQAASIAATVLSLGSVAYLYYNWRSWSKAKKAARLEALGETEKTESGKNRRMRWYSRIAGLFIIPVLLGTGFMGSAPTGPQVMQAVNSGQVSLVGDNDSAIALPQVHTPQAAPTPAAAAKNLSTVQIVQRNKAAVVNVMTNAGSGTGFIISPDGTLITNAHVVSDGINKATGKISRTHKTQIVIRLTNGMQVPAQVISYNPDKDMAIVKIIPQNPFGWPTITIGDSNTLLEGQEVVAMGFPLGQPFTVTKGIISGLGYRGNGFIQFQQHDAAVNPGNSGGPLFNMQGEVVGINTQIVSPSGAFAGISRSITSQDLKNALAQYAAQGNISSGWLGAIFYPNNPASDGFGAAVEGVRPDSPAALAGLQAGDIVVGIDGRGLPPNALNAFRALSGVMRTKAPTDSLTLQVDRDGTVIDIVVTLGAH